EQEVVRLGHALDGAEADLAAAELRLLWVAHDVYGLQEPEEALAAARRRAPEPGLELHRVKLRADLRFARLALAEVVLDLRFLCGAAPWPRRGRPRAPLGSGAAAAVAPSGDAAWRPRWRSCWRGSPAR